MKRIIEISEQQYKYIMADQDLYRMILAKPIVESIPFDAVEAEDCISRKATLQALNTKTHEYGNGLGYRKECGELINSMPSVYPKSDKPNTVSEETYTQEYCARKEAEFEVFKLKKQIEMLKLDRECDKPSGKWIPVSERLPDTEDEVLCWYEYYHWSLEKVLPEYGLGQYFKDTNTWGGEVSVGKDLKILAWMPLPEPYKMVEEQGENT